MMKRKNKVERVMHEFKDGDLRSSGGGKVTDPKQAVAIAMSEQRKYDEDHTRKRVGNLRMKRVK